MRRSRPDQSFVADEHSIKFAQCAGLSLRDERDAWLDWCAATGRLYVDQQAGFRTWLRHAVQYGRGKPELASPVTLRDVLGPYVCPLGLGCDNGWQPDTSPVRQCKCRDKTRIGSGYESEKEGAPTEMDAPNLTLFTDLVSEG